VIGTTVGSYRILSKLSTGGMGAVYRAEHVLIGKLAAVKVLHPELCSNQDVVNRFLNEARAATAIKHPGIVEVFDFGHMESGEAYLTMEFLEGMSLARRLTMRGQMGEGEAAMLLRGVCSALSAAHAKGIVHRDLKPDNIFLVTDPESPTGERPKLLDFGIAKLTEVGLARATTTGAVMGTPTYMSPEQCSGAGKVDHRADLYSLGCVFHELICGRPPFVSLGAGELIGAHLYVPPDPVSDHLPDVTEETERLIMSLLAKKPEERPQTARDLGHRLTAIAQRQGWITQSSPTGVTAPSLAQYAPARLATPTSEADEIGGNETLPSEPPGTPAPRAPSPARVDEPTTLSGAASSILDVPRRSRRGLGIAMAAAALIAGSTVAFFQLRGTGAQQPATAPIAPETKPEPPTAVETTPAIEPAKPPVEPAPVIVVEPAIEPAKPAITAAKPTAAPRKPAKIPGKAPAKPKQPTAVPAKPKKPSLIETDI
jgi:eukaryotic-like serine/threonine-protein kinase